MFLLVALTLSLSTPEPKVDCELIRARVAEYGKIRAYTWALSNGYSLRDISRIRKVCGL
jgi:hypothetical protein